MRTKHNNQTHTHILTDTHTLSLYLLWQKTHLNDNRNSSMNYFLNLHIIFDLKKSKRKKQHNLFDKTYIFWQNFHLCFYFDSLDGKFLESIIFLDQFGFSLFCFSIFEINRFYPGELFIFITIYLVDHQPEFCFQLTIFYTKTNHSCIYLFYIYVSTLTHLHIKT